MSGHNGLLRDVYGTDAIKRLRKPLAGARLCKLTDIGGALGASNDFPCRRKVGNLMDSAISSERILWSGGEPGVSRHREMRPLQKGGQAGSSAPEVVRSAADVTDQPDPATGLRVALFSGNYDCVLDGANQALRHLVEYLADQGAAVRIYSPTVSESGHPKNLVSVPSVAIPGRPEYRFALGLPGPIRDDIRDFAPTVIHLSAPDLLGWRARSFARELGVPVVASLHTRFETYLGYYGLGWMRPATEHYLRAYYRGCDYVLAPNEPIAADLRRSDLDGKVRIWSRGVDRQLFTPGRRDRAWRRAQGFADDAIIILFFGRLVVEKGLDTFAAVVKALRKRGYPIRPLIIGAGPARCRFERQLGDAVFTGHLEGDALGRAVASADILINPSVTEAFGNVNLEAMAAGLAIISADVPSAQALIEQERTGLLTPPHDIDAYVRAVDRLIRAPMLRKQLGDAATNMAKIYDWPTTLAAVLDTYRSAGAIPATGVRGPRPIRHLRGHQPGLALAGVAG